MIIAANIRCNDLAGSLVASGDMIRDAEIAAAVSTTISNIGI